MYSAWWVFRKTSSSLTDIVSFSLSSLSSIAEYNAGSCHNDRRSLQFSEKFSEKMGLPLITIPKYIIDAHERRYIDLKDMLGKGYINKDDYALRFKETCWIDIFKCDNTVPIVNLQLLSWTKFIGNANASAPIPMSVIEYMKMNLSTLVMGKGVIYDGDHFDAADKMSWKSILSHMVFMTGYEVSSVRGFDNNTSLMHLMSIYDKCSTQDDFVKVSKMSHYLATRPLNARFPPKNDFTVWNLHIGHVTISYSMRVCAVLHIMPLDDLNKKTTFKELVHFVRPSFELKMKTYFDSDGVQTETSTMGGYLIAVYDRIQPVTPSFVDDDVMAVKLYRELFPNLIEEPTIE